VDALYAQVFNYIMASMVEAKKQKKVEASYEVLRAARELERFGDLATNVAERVIYIVTGKLQEVNVDPESGGISN
jgi:phosphate transport system protein